ncbi:hypothetical protein CCZ20_26325 [Priestia aryabhattai]|uniref:hypothetical protein n=1 Tax=Priestia aryabhattai TaxID=412384 RepID=UPI000B514224|nr:hypothetical protein [Priestia aryabhattai]OVE34462.1 hypothetical protein CCZ20_26325 [Priestia aryabhattai]
MKLFLKTVSTALITISLMTACSEANTEHSPSKEEKVKMVDMATIAKDSNNKINEKQENENWQLLKNGILTYNQTSKGGYYSATVESAKYSKSNQDSGVITAKIQVENVRDDGKEDNLSEIRYYIKNKETDEKSIGKAIPESLEDFENLPSHSKITYDVIFEIKDVANLNSFYLYIDSNLDPFSGVKWKLENLTNNN